MSLIAPADHQSLRSRTNRRDEVNKREKHENAQTSNRILTEPIQGIPAPTWVLNQGLLVGSCALPSHWSVQLVQQVFFPDYR